MNIDQLKNSYQMKMPVVYFLNQFYGKIAAFVPIALMKNHTVYPVQVYAKAFTNVDSANADLLLQLKRP